MAGENLQDNPNNVITDFGNTGEFSANSYASRQQDNGENYGFTPELINTLSKNYQRMQQPDLSKATNQDWFPNADRSINVGTFSGPLGSQPLLAAGLPLIPFGIDEQARADAAAKSKLQNEQLLAGSSWNYREIKDKLRQESFNELQDNLWGTHLKDMQSQYGTLNGTLLAMKDPKAKRIQMAINNYASNLDDMFDVATDALMSFQKQQVGVGSSVTQKYKDPVTGAIITEKDVDGNVVGQGGKKYTPYVSPYTAQVANDYLKLVTRNPKEMKLEDLENYNPQTYLTVAKSLDQVVENTMNSFIKPDIDERIFSEMALGKIVNKDGASYLNGKLSTDKENVNYIVTSSGLSDDRMKEIAHASWQTAYGDAAAMYGEDMAKKILPSEKQVYDGLKGYVYNETKIALHNVSKMTPEEWARTQKIKQEVKPNIIPKEVIDYTGKKVQQWDLNDTDNLVFSSGKTAIKNIGGTKELLPNQRYTVVNVKTRDGNAVATVAPVTTQYQRETDALGNVITTPIENVDYGNQEEIPYNVVKSVVETNYGGESGKTLEGFPFEGVISYAERGKTNTQTKTNQGTQQSGKKKIAGF